MILIVDIGLEGLPFKCLSSCEKQVEAALVVNSEKPETEHHILTLFHSNIQTIGKCHLYSHIFFTYKTLL